MKRPESDFDGESPCRWPLEAETRLAKCVVVVAAAAAAAASARAATASSRAGLAREHGLLRLRRRLLC
eukprot:15385972-Heterocapsa_arctica.AAC.1